jgi:hypothetical protein
MISIIIGKRPRVISCSQYDGPGVAGAHLMVDNKEQHDYAFIKKEIIRILRGKIPEGAGDPSSGV